MPEFTHDWFNAHIPALAEALNRFVGKPAAALEVGCYEGRATLWFLDNILTHPDSRITCIDTFLGSIEHEERGIDFSGVYGRFRSNTEGRSVTTLVGTSGKWLPTLESESLDFIYIDGSHLARDVLFDSVLSWRALKPGGVIVWDDYGWHRYAEEEMNPGLAIDSFLACHKGCYKLLSKAYRVAVEKL